MFSSRICNYIAVTLSVVIAYCLYYSTNLFFPYWSRFGAWKYITQTISGKVCLVRQGKFRTKTPSFLSVTKKMFLRGGGGGATPFAYEGSQTGDQSPGRINIMHIMKQKSILHISNIEKWYHQLRHLPICLTKLDWTTEF